MGGGGSGSSDPSGQPNAGDKVADEIAARNMHEVLGLLGVYGDIDTTLSPDFDEFNLDDDLGRAVLIRTSAAVPGAKPGWTGGHFKNGDKEARVYWRTETGKNEYSYYGWWIDRDNANGGYSLAFFTDHSTTTAIDERSSHDVSDVTGSATYEGGAAGLYAIYSTVPKAHESGDFTADVTLKANFDTDRVSGMINGFMVDGSKKNWMISLQENTDDLVENKFLFGKVVWEIDGIRPSNADRTASEHVLGFRDLDTDAVPIIAVGLFDARNGSARIYGTYGTTKK